MNLSCRKSPRRTTAAGWVVVALAVGVLAACGGGGYGSPAPMVTPGKYASSLVVSDGKPTAPRTDANLKNAWGVAFNPSGFVWVTDNGSQVSTLYDGNGVAQSLVVAIPAGSNGPANPTGIVFNATADFALSVGGATGSTAFMFDGEGGTLAAWSPTIDLNNAVTVYDDGAGGAVYKGLAIAASGNANFLYAADFHNNKIDVFDTHFAKVASAGGFVDPALPSDYAPFGIQAIGGKLYVAYAKQGAGAHDEVDGAGLGAIDVFDADGHLLQRLVAIGGVLNAPWGMAMAPADFATFSGDLLVGNFGDGTINAFDPASGKFLGSLSGQDGKALVQAGLWGIAFGNGLNNQPANTLFFAAGPNDEADGAYGRIDTMP